MSPASVLHVDVAVIGAGTAGLAAFRAAKKAGVRAVLIGEPPFGTACAQVGCMPSKALLSAAKKAKASAALRAVLGRGGPSGLDTAPIMQDVRAKRDHFVASVKEGMADFGDEEFIEGRATFLDPQRLEIELTSGGRQAVTADKIIIATGSSPVILPGFDAAANVLTTDTLFELDTLPERIIIVGDGAIALECAFALHQLGNDVTLLGHGGPIGGLSDEQVGHAAQEALLGDVAYFADQSDLELVSATDDDGVAISFKQDGQTQTREADALLLAVGRKSNVGSLGLDAARVDLDHDGVPKRHPLTGQTSQDHIFIAGDATGTDTVLHAASREGQHAGNNACQDNVRATMEQPDLRLLFTEPGIAVVGSSRAALEHNGKAHVVGQVDFAEQGRALAEDRNVGRLHIYACPKTGVVLGSEMVAPDAEHLAHLIVAAMTAGWTIADFLAMPFYHPTVEEGLRTALRDAQHKLRHADAPLDNDLDIAAGC